MDWLSDIFTGGVFLTVAIIGLIVLVISVIIDGIFEAFNFGDGPISLTSIAAFVTVFGFGGYAASGAGVNPLFSAGIGLVLGALAGVLAFWLSSVFQKSESGTAISISGLSGQEAIVTLRIGSGDDMGEIAFIRGGERHTFAAKAEESILTGTKVVILSNITDSSVLVTPVKILDDNSGTSNIVIP
jgi:hypothetical protein